MCFMDFTGILFVSSRWALHTCEVRSKKNHNAGVRLLIWNLIDDKYWSSSLKEFWRKAGANKVINYVFLFLQIIPYLVSVLYPERNKHHLPFWCSLWDLLASLQWKWETSIQGYCSISLRFRSKLWLSLTKSFILFFAPFKSGLAWAI